MVGAFRVGGNTTPRGEWNAMVDPEALSVVLQALSPDGPTRWEPAAPTGGLRSRRHRTGQADAGHLDQLAARVVERSVGAA